MKTDFFYRSWDVSHLFSNKFLLLICLKVKYRLNLFGEWLTHTIARKILYTWKTSTINWQTGKLAKFRVALCRCRESSNSIGVGTFCNACCNLFQASTFLLQKAWRRLNIFRCNSHLKQIHRSIIFQNQKLHFFKKNFRTRYKKTCKDLNNEGTTNVKFILCVIVIAVYSSLLVSFRLLSLFLSRLVDHKIQPKFKGNLQQHFLNIIPNHSITIWNGS